MLAFSIFCNFMCYDHPRQRILHRAVPELCLWWKAASPTLRAALLTLLEDMPAIIPVLLIATTNCAAKELDPQLHTLFSKELVFRLEPPLPEARERYLRHLVKAAIASAHRGASLASSSDEHAHQQTQHKVFQPMSVLTTSVKSAVNDGNVVSEVLLAEEEHTLRQGDVGLMRHCRHLNWILCPKRFQLISKKYTPVPQLHQPYPRAAAHVSPCYHNQTALSPALA